MPSAKISKNSRSGSNKKTRKTAPLATDEPINTTEHDSQYNQTFINALEDVHTRFILNLPASETESSERIFFQIEQAWWFYEDFLCDDMDQSPDADAGQCHDDKNKEKTNRNNNDDNGNNNNKNLLLPRFKNVKPFAKKIFEISPLLSPLLPKFDTMWNDFSRYRRQISTYGTILLNKRCTKVVLCQDWNSKAWTFPAGKVNQNERGVDAGARETYEETGFDPNCKFGKTKMMKKEALEEEEDEEGGVGVCLPWNELKEGDDNAFGYVEDGSGKRRTCFVCWGVPESFPFAPVARKEVSKVEWHDLNNLPKKTYAVHPFMSQLKRWIKNHRKNERKNKDRKVKQRKQQERSGSSVKDRSQSRGSRSSRSNSSRSIITENDDVFKSSLGNVGDDNGWDENKMFIKNEELIGRKIDYDGNPQQFATKGFDGIDPHAFRVVGGQLMNSGGASGVITPSKPQSKSKQLIQYIDREEEVLQEGELKPFFSDVGVSPWGDVMAEALAEDAAEIQKKRGKTKIQRDKKTRTSSITDSDSSSLASPQPEETSFVSVASNSSGLSILSMLRRGDNSDDDVTQGKKEEFGRTIPAVLPSPRPPLFENVGIIMTDKEVTASRQSKKLKDITTSSAQFSHKNMETDRDKVEENIALNRINKREVEKKGAGNSEVREVAPILRLCEWANSLPKSGPTKHFGEFQFDVDSIMQAMKSK